MDNVSPSGSLDVDSFQRVMLMYRNTTDPETKASPALILFGRPIRDAIPIPMGRYTPHETWTELMSHREQALARRHSREHEKWNEHTHRLPPLRVGDHVYLQNLVGNHPRRWERTGSVVEVRQFHQYVIRVDGSGRVTLWNRQHLRKFTPFHRQPIGGTSTEPSPVMLHSQLPGSTGPKPSAPDPITQGQTTPRSRPPVPLVGPQMPLSPTRPSGMTSTPPRGSPPPQVPRRLQFDHDNPTPSGPSTPPSSPGHRTQIPRTVAHLQPHNKAGAKELLSPRRSRHLCGHGDDASPTCPE